MDSTHVLALATGVFFGNWLVVPIFFRSRTLKDGFVIGVIAAVLIIAIYGIIGK